MKRWLTMFAVTALLLGLLGCDIPWRGVASALAGAGYGDISYIAASVEFEDDNESWWKKNDEHLEWMIWPINELFD
jgi:hypothetical protein